MSVVNIGSTSSLTVFRLRKLTREMTAAAEDIDNPLSPGTAQALHPTVALIEIDLEREAEK